MADTELSIVYIKSSQIKDTPVVKSGLPAPYKDGIYAFFRPIVVDTAAANAGSKEKLQIIQPFEFSIVKNDKENPTYISNFRSAFINEGAPICPQEIKAAILNFIGGKWSVASEYIFTDATISHDGDDSYIVYFDHAAVYDTVIKSSKPAGKVNVYDCTCTVRHSHTYIPGNR